MSLKRWNKLLKVRLERYSNVTPWDTYCDILVRIKCVSRCMQWFWLGASLLHNKIKRPFNDVEVQIENESGRVCTNYKTPYTAPKWTTMSSAVFLVWCHDTYLYRDTACNDSITIHQESSHPLIESALKVFQDSLTIYVWDQAASELVSAQATNLWQTPPDVKTANTSLSTLRNWSRSHTVRS